MLPYFNRHSLALLSLCILLISACTQKSGDKVSREQQLIGNWDAQWKPDPIKYKDMPADMQYTMAGKASFSADGKVTVTSYGYPNCLFKQDTTVSTSYWSVDADYLYLGDEPGGKTMQYYVQSSSKERNELRMLDDINISL